MTERMLADTAFAHPINFCALRYFNVAGADPDGRSGQSTAGATHLIKVAVEAATGKRDGVSVYGTDYDTPDGTGVRDYIHVSDLAAAHVHALEKLVEDPEASHIMNCGYGRGFSVLEVLDAVDRVTNVRVERRLEARRAGDPDSLVADNGRILATLPWRPQTGRSGHDRRPRSGLGEEAGGAGLIVAAAELEIRDLLARGQEHARARDSRAAASFFAAALRAAAASGPLPAPLVDELNAAQAYLREAAAAYQAHLERAVAGAKAGPRLDEALAILLGRAPLRLPPIPYAQRPSVFHFPGLPQRPFYERDEFGWSATLEAATDAIRGEVEALLAEGADFRPYVEQEKNRPQRDFHGLQGDPSWTAFYLWKDGAAVAENQARCPRTTEAIRRVPLSAIGSRTPSVFFSLLRPGAHIPPHHGMLNSRLICHLPLIVPPGGWLRVGGETRFWEEGRLLVFDDSIEHEARNPSEALRVVLIFDIWRPELSESERHGVSAIFDAIDSYSPNAAPQQDA